MRGKHGTALALAAALVGVAAAAEPVFLTASLTNEINTSFRFGALTLGLSVAVFHLVGLVVSPFVAPTLRRTGIRRSLQISALITCLSSLAIALWARSAIELIGILLVAGISNGLAGPTASGLLHTAVPRAQHGLAFGVQQAGAPSSVLLGGLAVPAIGIPFGWRTAFMVSVALSIVAAVLAGGLPESSIRSVRSRARTQRRVTHATAILSFAAAVASGAGVASVSFLVLFATRAGISGDGAALLLMGVSAAAVVGRTMTGFLIDRHKRDPLLAATAMFAGCSLALFLLFAATPATIVAGALVMGAMGWAWHGTLTLAVTSRNQDAPVSAVGTLMSGVFAGAVGGPLLVGAIAARSSLSTAWLVCLVLSLAPLALVARVRRMVPSPGATYQARPKRRRRLELPLVSAVDAGAVWLPSAGHVRPPPRCRGP